MKRILADFPREKYVLMFVVVMVLGIPELRGQSSGFGDFGIGGGLSYGGLGARATFRPIEKLGLFGSLGYNFDDLGYNFGVQYHVPSSKKLSVYLTGMYGYNTVLIVDAIVMKTKTTYYGFSSGVGIELKMREKSFFCTEVLIPFRPQAYKDAVDDLTSINYEIKDPLPVAFCVGYHFKF